MTKKCDYLFEYTQRTIKNANPFQTKSKEKRECRHPENTRGDTQCNGCRLASYAQHYKKMDRLHKSLSDFEVRCD